MVIEKLNRKRTTYLKSRFSKLLTLSIKIIKDKVELENFKTYVTGAFPHIASIWTESTDHNFIFNAITSNCGWSCTEHEPLFGLLEVLVDEETKKYRDTYLDILNGCRIIEYISSLLNKDLSLLHDCPRSTLPSPGCDTLSAKLIPPHEVPINIDQGSLTHVHKIWCYLLKEFNLPKMDNVLYSIERGCLFVTWCIPANKEIKELIREHIPQSEQFLMENRVVLIMFNDECLYRQLSCFSVQDDFQSSQRESTI